MFKGIVSHVNEKLTSEESAEIGEKLAYPSMLPQDFDQTFEAWFYRLSLIWGTVKIILNDPENRVMRKEINKEKFFDIVGNEEEEKIFGPWSKEQLAVDKVVFYRNYLAYDGRRYKKELVVKVDLKPSLKKQLNINKGIFGWFLK